MERRAAACGLSEFPQSSRLQTFSDKKHEPEDEAVSRELIRECNRRQKSRLCSLLFLDRFLAMNSAETSPRGDVPVNNNKLTFVVKAIGELVKRVNSVTRRTDGTINRLLSDFLEYKVAANEKAVNGVSSKDIVIDKRTNVWVRIFTPEISSPDDEKVPVLVYYHGGGFGVLSADTVVYDRFCRRIARKCKMVVVSVNYRRAPEHKFPVAYDDSFEALKWLRSASSTHSLPIVADVSRTILCGDSAGGNIVHFMGCRSASADLSPVAVRGMILLQPYFGSQARVDSEIKLVNVPIISIEATDWFWKAYLPEDADRDHPACNIFGPNAADISGLNLPPVFVAVSDLDVLMDHQVNYVRKLQDIGKNVTMRTYDGGVHGFYFLEKLETRLFVSCLNHMKDFIESNVNSHVERGVDRDLALEWRFVS